MAFLFMESGSYGAFAETMSGGSLGFVNGYSWTINPGKIVTWELIIEPANQILVT